MVRNHRIAASKGVSEDESWTDIKPNPCMLDGVECDLINWPLGA